MSILTLENVTKQYREEPLFSGLTLGVEWGEKIGIIGTNGSGKSTLLRLLAGVEATDSGGRVLTNDAIIAYLPQNPAFQENETVLEAIFSASSETMRLVAEYEEACRQLASTPDERVLLERVSSLANRLEACGAWDLETNARVVLTRLGVGDTQARMGALSGGMRKRVALAHALITRPDLLILDEPTNHLDTDAIDWLETFLSHYGGALVLVTHDRYFLDRVVHRIIEIDRGVVQSFSGNYARYLERKAEQEQQKAASEEKRDNLARRELEWLQRGPRARATKQKARQERARELLGTPREEAVGQLDIAVGARRLGGKTIEMKHVSKRYGNQVVVHDFTHIFKRGGRVGIIGPNGCGKTTLLDMIAQRLEPDQGEVQLGQTVCIGYYQQESQSLPDDLRVIAYIKEAGDSIPTSDGGTVSASQMLERFLFRGAVQHSYIGRLSGGERRRLYLLRILMGNPNVLLLDEPTNDLDIPTLARLENYLETFGGCLIVASHDRYFLDRTVDCIFRMEDDGRLREYPGNYSRYLEVRQREQEAAAVVPKKTKAAAQYVPMAVAAPAKKLSFKERQELQALETAIARNETRKREVEELLGMASSDSERTHRLYVELQTLNGQLDRDMERWSVLAESDQ